MCSISTACRSNASAKINVAAPSERGVTKKDDTAKLPVSVFIIAKDEAVRLPRCLAALVSWAGEIVLVDSGSTDQTVEIGEAYGAKVCHRAWNGYGAQKRFAEQKCRYDWVLNVDADEVVTQDLTDEIKALFEKTPPQPDAFRLRILTVYPGKTKPRLWANDYNVVRLYHRSIGSYSDDAVHDRVDLAGC
jgi:glycosyltransferase involved in cell wall biosynthesis